MCITRTKVCSVLFHNSAESFSLYDISLESHAIHNLLLRCVCYPFMKLVARLWQKSCHRKQLGCDLGTGHLKTVCTLHWKCCNGARYLRGLQGNDDDNILPNMNCFFRFWSAWHVFVFLSICFSIYLTFLLILTQLLCVSNEITQIVYCPSNCLIRLQPYTLSSLNIPQLFESLCVFLYFVPH